MKCRIATDSDKLNLIRKMQNKQVEWFSSRHIHQDILYHTILICEDEAGKILGQCTLFWDEEHNYLAIKRFVVSNKKDQNKGVGSFMLNYLCENYDRLGSTPWINNEKMRYLLEKHGFELQYVFREQWAYYLRA